MRTAAGTPGSWIETDYDYYPDGSTWKVTDARDVIVTARRLCLTSPGLRERE